jgi:putative endonuclease
MATASEQSALPVGGRQRLGQWGERIAALHLEARGYAILDRNWRCGAGEIDLVARDAETVVFVEVKTRRGRAYGAPEEALTPRKAEKLMRLGQQYVYEHDLGDVDWRIDLIAVELDERGRMLRCEHIPNAVLGW